MILRLCYILLCGACLSLADNQCSLGIELVVVQDVSSGVSREKQAQLAEELGKLSESLSQNYPSLKMGLSTFVDKPIAYLGWSNEYGGHPDSISDWCYRKETELTNDFDNYSELLRNVVFGAGVDVPEAQYEAILRTALDDSLGWSDPSVDYFDDGSAPLRIMLLLTDSDMHLAGDGQKGLDLWTSQYGTQDWCNMPVISDQDLCQEAISLKPVIIDGSATDEQIERWDYIQSILGPMEFPKMKVHPGNLTGNDGCTEYDYPDYTFMITVLEERKINPIYALLTDGSSGYNNWKWLTDEYANQNTSIMAHLIHQTSFESLNTVLVGMIGEIGVNWCDHLPPFTPPTEAATTVETTSETSSILSSYEETTTSEDTTSSSEEETSTTDEPTSTSEESITASEDTTSTSEEATSATEEPTSTSEEPTATSEDTTSTLEEATSATEAMASTLTETPSTLADETTTLPETTPLTTLEPQTSSTDSLPPTSASTSSIISTSSEETTILTTLTSEDISTEELQTISAASLATDTLISAPDSTEDATTTEEESDSSATIGSENTVSLFSVTTSSDDTSVETISDTSATDENQAGSDDATFTDEGSSQEEDTPFTAETSTTESTLVPGGGLPIGVIAGATAGGAVALAAIATGLLSFGGGWKRDTTSDAQVEVPEEPIDREVPELVTPEMYS